jgi:hypothetical protein
MPSSTVTRLPTASAALPLPAAPDAQRWTAVRRMRIVTLAAALILLLTVSVRGEQITTDQKDFLVSGDGRYVVLQGTWRRTSQRPTVEVPYVNSVRIECDRLNSRRDKEVWQYIVGVAAHLEYLAVAILWVHGGKPGRFQDYEDHLTLGQAISKIEGKGLLAPAIIDTARAINRLRNSVAHRGAVSGVTVPGTAQRGLYKGGHVFTELEALRQVVSDAEAAIRAMGEWLRRQEAP